MNLESPKTPWPLLENFKIVKGIGYECKGLGSNKLSGDGSVPYASLSYCFEWTDKIPSIVIKEIPGVNHRDILSHPSLFEVVLTAVSHRPRQTSFPVSPRSQQDQQVVSH